MEWVFFVHSPNKDIKNIVIVNIIRGNEDAF